ncbi:MAG: sensor histidine kinase [Acidimicrobiales bacterium]
MNIDVRTRLTILAAVVVGVALVVGGLVTVTLLERNLEDNLDQSLDQQARDRAQLLEGGADPQSLVDSRLREAFVWIGTASGQPVAVGGAVRPVETPPLDLGAPATVDLLIEETAEPDEGPEQYSFRVATASTSDGQAVAVGAQIEEVDNAVGEVTNILLVGTPILVGLVAALTWVTTGRALRPVDDIRRKAADISGARLDERVPVPAGRDEIHELALTMNGMLDRLDAHQQAMARFTADASHELKSPVANIRSLVETATIEGEEWAQLEPRITAETERLRDLVENLLYLAAHDDDASPPRSMVAVDVDELLFDEAQVVAATTDRRVDVSGVEPLQVTGDRGELRQLVRNLSDNAVRHAHSTVSYAATLEGDMVTMRVSDDGDGVPPDRRDAVFERFARLDAPRDRHSGGTGLGLAISRQIARSHGGDVVISDNGRPGATFEVRIPVRRASSAFDEGGR